MDMTKALIIVDVQNDFIAGSLPCQDGKQTARRIGNALNTPERGGYDYVITTQDWHVNPGEHFEEWPEHCQAYTWGAALHDDIKNLKVDAYFQKGHFSAAYSGFEGTGYGGMTLVEFLTENRVTEVDVVGLAFEHCVKATAIDAAKLGFHTRVLGPYTSSVCGGEIVTRAREEMITQGVSLADVAEIKPIEVVVDERFLISSPAQGESY
jgi:nicotinamidase/pyrazinamidase